MNKLNFETVDTTESNISKIAELFPNVVTEDENGKSIDFELLRQELSSQVVEGNKERYQLTWPGKKEAILMANTPINKTLRPIEEKSVGFANTENVYIEGDNLEALKILQESYLNKIKMIYIDPPYNTGKDFIYKDKFSKNSDEELLDSGQIDEYGNRLVVNADSSGKYHSDWLSMMYPRLKLARNLLTDDGVIFISIDDNEVDNLKKITDEIFGENNFIALLSVENNPKGRKNSDFVSISSEFLLIVAKDKNKSRFIENIPKKASDMTLDSEGVFVHNSGKRVLVGENSYNKPVSDANSSKNYSVYYRKKDNSLIIVKGDSEIEKSDLTSRGYFEYKSRYNDVEIENTYTDVKLLEMHSNNLLEFGAEKIYEKNIKDTTRIKSQLVNREYKAIVNGKKQKYSMELTTTGAGTQLKDLFESSELHFSAPKNIGYLKVLITLFYKNDITVLDFFSGSATTAHAVMKLNAEDGGNRKFIMVQVPEPINEKDNKEAYKFCVKNKFETNICSIGQERIRRASKQIKEETNADIDYGFRVFKVDSSNMKDIYFKPHEFKQEQLFELENNIKEDRSARDLLTSVILDLGLTLDLPIESKFIMNNEVFYVADNTLVACFEPNFNVDLINELCSDNPLKLVFRESCFKTDNDKINVAERIKKLSPNTEIHVL